MRRNPKRDKYYVGTYDINRRHNERDPVVSELILLDLPLINQKVRDFAFVFRVPVVDHNRVSGSESPKWSHRRLDTKRRRSKGSE